MATLKDLQARERELEAALKNVRAEIAVLLEGGPRVRVTLQRGLKSLRNVFANDTNDPRIGSNEDQRALAFQNQEGDQLAYSNSTVVWVTPAEAIWLHQHPDHTRWFWVDEVRS